METRYEQMTKGGLDGYSNFIGDDSEYRNWYGVVGRSYASKPLERSNFRVALEMLGGEGENVIVCRYRHWAVKWIEEVYVRPNTKEYEIACKIEQMLEDYDILDEHDLYEEEYQEACEIWANCYSNKERIEFIRVYRSEFEFYDFKDLINVARGKYYNGLVGRLVY